MDSFKSFVFSTQSDRECDTQPILQNLVCEQQLGTETGFATYATTYISGYLAKKLLGITKECPVCIMNFTTKEPLSEHALINTKQNVRNSLLFKFAFRLVL